MGRLHRLIPSFCQPVLAGAILVSCLLLASRAGAQHPGPGGVIYSKQAGFRIPFDVPPGERRIQQVQLFISEDLGRTWRQFASAAPSEGGFGFQATRDGTYWFAVRTIDFAGRGYPATPEQTQPGLILKVVVDTAPPAVNLRPIGGQDASSVGVEWQVRDEYLDLESLRLDYRPANTNIWQPINCDRLATAQRVWNPQTNSPLDVRLSVSDLAGNRQEAIVSVTPGNTSAGSAIYSDTGANRTTSTANNRPNVRLVNSKRISLNYQLSDVGPSKLSAVELWYTRDTRLWEKCPDDRNLQSPYVFDVPGEGLYGFTLIARSGVGTLGEPAPKPGDQPQVWVEVDLTKPDVQLRNVDVGRGADSGNLTIAWQAFDKNLGRQPITLSYAERADGPWTPIAQNLENSGRYVWRMPPGVPFSFLVRIEATDLASNVGSAQSDAAKPVIVDLSQPKIQVLEVAPVTRQ
jgi:hypothetical protein